jgi:hypothetical protein
MASNLIAWQSGSGKVDEFDMAFCLPESFRRRQSIVLQSFLQGGFLAAVALMDRKINEYRRKQSVSEKKPSKLFMVLIATMSSLCAFGAEESF